MKKVLFGISLIVCSTLGILSLIFSVIPISQTLGVLNGSSNIFVYLNWYGLSPFFYIFLVMGVAGIIICVKEAYFDKGIK